MPTKTQRESWLLRQRAAQRQARELGMTHPRPSILTTRLPDLLAAEGLRLAQPGESAQPYLLNGLIYWVTGDGR